jgi:hypothetical protein
VARSEWPAGSLCSPPALRLPALPPNIEQGSSDAAPQNHDYPALLPRGREPPPRFSTRSSDRTPNMSSRRETVETNDLRCDYGDTPVFTLLPCLRSEATMLGWGHGPNKRPGRDKGKDRRVSRLYCVRRARPQSIRLPTRTVATARQCRVTQLSLESTRQLQGATSEISW